MSAIGSIGLAHVGEIGNNTLEIAQDKAGIYKAGCPALTLVQEEHSVMRALESAAHRAGCSSFTVVPRLKWLEKLDSIGLAGPHQVNNASLALYIVQAALSSPRCPPAFQQAAKEMQDPRYRPPIIVQPDQPKPWHVKVLLPGLQMVAKDPRLAFNLLAFLILGTYYAAQHCARLYSEGGWPAVQPVAPVYVSATILTYLAVSERYRKSRRRRYWEDEGRSRGTGRLPSLGLSPSLRCGKVFRALAKTRWPGRAEVLRDPASSAVLYLDVSAIECANLAGLTSFNHSVRTRQKASNWLVAGSPRAPAAQQSNLTRSRLHPTEVVSSQSPPLSRIRRGRGFSSSPFPMAWHRHTAFLRSCCKDAARSMQLASRAYPSIG